VVKPGLQGEEGDEQGEVKWHRPPVVSGCSYVRKWQTGGGGGRTFNKIEGSYKRL